MYCTVRESHRGLSLSSEYHFVAEGNELRHISYYASSKRRISRDYVEYFLDPRNLYGKRMYEVMASNSGIFCWANTYPAEDICRRWDERRSEEVSLAYLGNFRFLHLTFREKLFLQRDWRLYYVPMIEELRRLLGILRNLNQRYPFVSLTSLAQCQIESGAEYPLSYLIPYSEVARRRSLEGLTKTIHQLWIATKIMAELHRSGRLINVFLDFRQSSRSSVASFSCRGGPCFLWYEFDMNPLTMCEGMLWSERAPEWLKEFYRRAREVLERRGLRRAPLRPDIAILGNGPTCSDLTYGLNVRMLIECKNWDYEYWSKDIDHQIIPYSEIFRPDVTVLASLKEVPGYVKEVLKRYRIVTIDNVHPKGRGMTEILNLISSL